MFTNEITLTLAFLTGLIIVSLSMPTLINVADLKNLCDEPKEARKIHKRKIPTIGGILIFAGTVFAFTLWYPSGNIGDFKYIISACIVLFFIGIKDDIIGTAPSKKLLAHAIVAFILIMMGDIRLKSMHGLFGITNIPYWASFLLSFLTYISIVNAFNLIDGVDGLASGVGFIACVFFAFWFYYTKEYIMATLAFALAGSLLGFLFFNFYPARIFMGDSGALIIGLIISVLAINFIEQDKLQLPSHLQGISKPVFAIAVLIYPLSDTLRIFLYRISKGKSPLMADANHLHHRLISIGLRPKWVSIAIYMYSLIIITIAWLSSGLDPSIQLANVVASSTLIILGIHFIYNKKTHSIHK